MAIAMRGHLMAFSVDDLHDLRSSLCNISQNKEGGFHSKPVEKIKDLFHIG
jgi:hypothetical protein